VSIKTVTAFLVGFSVIAAACLCTSCKLFPFSFSNQISISQLIKAIIYSQCGKWQKFSRMVSTIYPEYVEDRAFWNSSLFKHLVFWKKISTYEVCVKCSPNIWAPWWQGKRRNWSRPAKTPVNNRYQSTRLLSSRTQWGIFGESSN
jgi:hypothetical protein